MTKVCIDGNIDCNIIVIKKLELSQHMCEQGHYMLPHDSSTWDQAQ